MSSSNRKCSRSISDATKFDCQCGHEDCQLILQRKLKALAQHRESLLSPLGKSRRISNASSGNKGGISPLPALFRRLSLYNKHTTSEAKQYGKVRKIFFSPHPDDVAYSCFGLASSASASMASSTSSAMAALHQDTLVSDFDNGARSNDGSSTGKRSESAGSIDSVLTPDTVHSPVLQDEVKNEFEQSTLFSSLTNPNPNPSQTQSKTQDNWIVTVFSKSRCANGLIGQSLGHCVRATTELRQREDEEFARSIDAKLISLDLRDTSARDEGSRHPELLANSQSSLSSLSVNHPKFEYVKQRIRPYVEWAIECQATIHIPVAVGCHIDHWMVRVAILSILYELEQENRWVQWSETHNERSIDRDEEDVQVQRQDLMRRFSISHHNNRKVKNSERIGSQLIFYEDLPYAFLGTDDAIERTVTKFLPRDIRTQLIPLTESDWNRKVAAVKGYASQLKPTLIDHLHDHALLLAKRANTIDESWIDAPKTWTKAERSWVLDDICGSSGKLLTCLASHTMDGRRTSSRSINKKKDVSEENNPTFSTSPLKPSPIQFRFTFDAKPEFNRQDESFQTQILSPRSKTHLLDDNLGPHTINPFAMTQDALNPRENLRRLSMGTAEVP